MAQHPAEFVRCASRRGGTERGDAVARQTGRHTRHRIAFVERVEAVNAVHMDVDEAGDNVVIVEREVRRLRITCPWRLACTDLDDPILRR